MFSLLTKKLSICGLNRFSKAPLNKMITPWTATNIYLVMFGISKVTSDPPWYKIPNKNAAGKIPIG